MVFIDQHDGPIWKYLNGTSKELCILLNILNLRNLYNYFNLNISYVFSKIAYTKTNVAVISANKDYIEFRDHTIFEVI